MGEAKRRKELAKQMGQDIKIVGLDGKEIRPPSKENPVVPHLQEEPLPICRIDRLPGPGGQFAIKALQPIPVIDLCIILSQLVGSLLNKAKNENKIVGT